MANRHIFSCWKEIAEHLGCGVRTAQRWERTLGLPVRRPAKENKHLVSAYANELDDWRMQWKTQDSGAVGQRLHVSLDRLKFDSSTLEAIIREARARRARSIVITFANADSLASADVSANVGAPSKFLKRQQAAAVDELNANSGSTKPLLPTPGTRNPRPSDRQRRTA